jgi:hypothetical protein
MNVEDRLTTRPVAIQDQSVARLMYSFLAGEIPRDETHSAEKLRVRVLQAIDRIDMLSGNDQGVERGLGTQISKCDTCIVGMDHIGFDFPFRDLAEDTGH